MMGNSVGLPLVPMPRTRPRPPHSWRSGLHAGLFLLLLLAWALSCRQCLVTCKPMRYARLAADTGAGGTPFRADHFGPEVQPRDLQLKPIRLTFEDGRHARVDWLSFDLVTSTEVVYSASEELARDSRNPAKSTSMKRFSEGLSDRVWLAFRSPICRDAAVPGKTPCREFGDPAPLVVELSCSR